MDELLKHCPRCEQAKPVSDFGSDRSRPDGLFAYCKRCASAHQQQMKAQRRQRLGSDAVKVTYHLGRRCGSCKRVLPESEFFRNAHRSGGFSANCKTCDSARVARRRKTNPEKFAEVQNRRRARQMARFVDRVEPLVLLERDDGVCGICGEDVDPNEFHIDHIVPLARGGEHSTVNCQVTHPACNRRKHASLPY